MAYLRQGKIPELRQDQVEAFVNALYDDAAKRGLSIDYPVYVNGDERNPGPAFENALVDLKKKFGKNLGLGKVLAGANAGKTKSCCFFNIQFVGLFNKFDLINSGGKLIEVFLS